MNDAAALREFLRQQFPEIDLPENAASRVMGVARFRDTKALKNDSAEIISLRAWRDDALLKIANLLVQ